MKKTKATRASSVEVTGSSHTWDADPAFLKAYAEEYPFEHIADRILQLRADLGWTQQELAGRAGTTQSVIARAESGRHSFRIDLLDRIAAAADVRWWPQFDRVPNAGDGIVVLANPTRSMSQPYAIATSVGPEPAAHDELALTANAND